jgi:MoxR-like ATPase
MVLATQNPIELEGTYPLPEAQLDRFFFKLLVSSPSPEELREILHRTTGAGLCEAAPVLSSSGSEIIDEMKLLLRQVIIAPPLEDYVVRLVPLSPKSGSTSASALAHAGLKRSFWGLRGLPCSRAGSM